MKCIKKVIDTPVLSTSVVSKSYIPVQSQFAESLNINNIVARFASGDLSVLGHSRPFADVSLVPVDLFTALEQNRSIGEIFDSLPDDVKSVYSSPSALLSALQDESQRDTLVKLGIFKSTKVSPEKAEPSSGEVHA